METADLATRARIRDAALDGFAHAGFDGSSIRTVARAAGVSAGSVQHFFPTKRALREAVNEHVAGLAADAFSTVTTGVSATDVSDELGARIAAFVRDHPIAVRYVARSLIENDEAAVGLFDALVAFATAQWARADQDDLLRPDVDQLWAALNVVVLNFGTVLLADVLDNHLPERFTSPQGLDRWRRAQTDLFRGLYRRGS